MNGEARELLKLMPITVKNLIQFLPIDEKVRQQVLAKYDGFSDDQKLAMSKLCWTMFYELLHAQTNYEFKKALLDVKEGKGKLKNTLYKEIEERVYKKMVDDLRKGGQAEAIKEVREKIQKAVQEKAVGS